MVQARPAEEAYIDTSPSHSLLQAVREEHHAGQQPGAVAGHENDSDEEHGRISRPS